MAEEKIYNPDDIGVTDVKVYPFRTDMNTGRIRAIATIVLNGAFRLSGIRVKDYGGDVGLAVEYPNDPFYKGEDCRYLACPVTRELRTKIEQAVLDAYGKAIV